VSTTTIGVDLGVTAASDVAVAEGATVTVLSEGGLDAGSVDGHVRQARADGPVNVVVESTAMAWFVAAVAVLRSGIEGDQGGGAAEVLSGAHQDRSDRCAGAGPDADGR
jgi:hypothetical protein